MKLTKTTILILILLFVGLGIYTAMTLPGHSDDQYGLAAGRVIGVFLFSLIVTLIARYVFKAGDKACNMTVVITAIVMVVSVLNQDFHRVKPKTVVEQLQTVAQVTNEHCPQKIDKITELQSLIYNVDLNRLIYNYRILDETFVLPPNAGEQLKAGVEANIGKNAHLKDLLDQTKCSLHCFYSLAGKQILEVTVR